MFSLLLITTLLLPTARVARGDELFETRVRPMLHEHCLQCHGPDKQSGGLRVDSREALLEGGDTGPALVPGDPSASLLLKAVRHSEPGLKMPPAKAGAKLSAQAIEALQSWVEQGAIWPAGEGAGAAVSKEAFDLAKRKGRLPWIWQTPQAQVVPEVQAGRSLSDVDRFILAKLTEKGIEAAPLTDDRTWLRRAHFAITGLPPRLEEIRAFLADTSAERKERVVDGLLASPHFGERWARHWMDLMRYAETRGHESDYAIANAWQYRDYLIRAFNADVPYDRFVAEHVAGDLIPARVNPQTGANESVLATGWAFLGEEVHSPVDIRQDECDRVDNKVDVLTKSVLGLTVACARCHDHKFDAISQRDYYALSGFVLSSSFRQARFETMEAHAQAAARLTKLRAQHSGPIAAAFARSTQSGLSQVSPYLRASRRVLLGADAQTAAREESIDDTGLLNLWIEQLKAATTAPDHPLHQLSLILFDSQANEPERFRQWRDQATRPSSAAPDGLAVIADYTQPGRTPWLTDGPALGAAPRTRGEVILGSPEQPIARIMPYGAASRDPFWNRLALAPGTEQDSGSLGAAARAGKTLRTPKVTLDGGRLHYLLRGKAQVYAGVDSHIMVTGPLHGGLVANYDTAGQLRWVTQDLSAYSGHRVHLEFAPLEQSGFELLMVVESEAPPVWTPLLVWQPPADVRDLEAVVTAWQADLGRALKGVESGTLRDDPQFAALADWLVQHPALLAAKAETWATVAGDYFHAQEALAQTIRWDSPTAVAWADGTGVDENVLIRGKPMRPGPVAVRGLPAAFGLPPIPDSDSSGRSELARQLSDPSNPLVARVLVNRVWHHLFGRGIVPTVDNFGFLGERPSHPELLDHLAWQFMSEDDWSLKRLVRKLVLTDTFARSSRSDDRKSLEVDPANLLLHHMPVKRLQAESIRDSLLVISGRFDPTMYGSPVPVHLTEFVIGRGRPDASGPLDGAGRRSIYTSVRRNFLPTMMLAFDYPTPFSTVGRRNTTNVPAQSLVMMNDPFVHEQASLWSARLLRELPDAAPPERIAWLFETAYGRLPSPDEQTLALKSFSELQGLYQGDSDQLLWSEFCHALLSANELIYLN